MLKLVEPYVTYGEPNLATVRSLVYKRGFAKVNGQRVPISSNAVIEEKLGPKGIICIEDLVHEIATVGPNFKVRTSPSPPSSLLSPLLLRSVVFSGF